MVVCRASPLKNESPRAGDGTSAGGRAGVEAGGAEEAASAVSGAAEEEAGGGGVDSTGLGSGGVGTGEALFVLDEAAGVDLG
jgi:hypothetical protein